MICLNGRALAKANYSTFVIQKYKIFITCNSNNNWSFSSLNEQSIAIFIGGICIAFNFVRPFELDRSIANFLRIRIFINRIFSHLYYLSIFIDISHISSITSPSSPWMSTINYLLRRINHLNLFLHTSSEGHFRQSSKSIARSTFSLVSNRRREWISSTFN